MKTGLKFAMIGVAGYVAKKHLQAIKSIGGQLVCAIDTNDSVGQLDQYFPDCRFETCWEIFDYEIDLLKNKNQIDYVVVCSPNDLHFYHCQWALKKGIYVICEKPIVIRHNHIDLLQKTSLSHNARIFPILQMRHHPVFFDLPNLKSIDCEIQYFTPRGMWYSKSWKSNQNVSGGLLFNIGIHLLDMMDYKFGPFADISIIKETSTEIKGKMKSEKGVVQFHLSTESHVQQKRLFKINGIEYDFSNGFHELHNVAYKNILENKGHEILSCKNIVRLINESK